MKRAKQSTTAEIQKEQLFLVQLERELTNVLGNINESLNTLKVEELQLRSNAVNLTRNREAGESGNQLTETVLKVEEHPTFNDNPEVVNQQELDLGIYISHANEEEDEE